MVLVTIAITNRQIAPAVLVIHFFFILIAIIFVLLDTTEIFRLETVKFVF
jgi:hypothetical protein